MIKSYVTLGIEFHNYTNMDQITVQVKIVYNYSKGWLVLFLSFYFTSI